MNSMNSQSRYFYVLRQNLKHTRQHFTPETFLYEAFLAFFWNIHWALLLVKSSEFLFFLEIRVFQEFLT